jgi:hypothetical protein
MKIGIIPDVEQTTGRGKINLFSFKNLIEFALANAASDIGMSPKLISMSLKRIHNWNDASCLHYFDQTINLGPKCIDTLPYIQGINFHVASCLGAIFSCFSGQVDDEFKCADIFYHISSCSDAIGQNFMRYPLTPFQTASAKWSTNVLSYAKGHMTLNLYEIKKEVIHSLTLLKHYRPPIY